MRIIIVIIAVSLFTSSCGAVIKSRYLKPSLPDNSRLTNKEWDNGLAVATGNICVWAGESHSSYNQMISEGPLGLPLIPNDLSSQLPERSPIVEFEIWLTVDKDYAGYAISPKNIALIYSDGSKRNPEMIRMDRIKTEWGEPHLRITTAEKVERLNQIEPVNFDLISDPVDLWNWTRIYINYSRPSTTAIPEQLRIQGLKKNGSEIEIPTFQLKDVVTTNYRVAKIPRTPADPCRDLFNMRKAQ